MHIHNTVHKKSVVKRSKKEILSELGWISIHVIFWIIVAYFYLTSYSFRPKTVTSMGLEIVSLVMIITVIYFNYFVIYPRIFKSNKIFYWVITFISLVVLSFVEMEMFMPDLEAAFKDLALVSESSQNLLFFSFMRNTGLLLFVLLLKHSRDINQMLKAELELVKKTSQLAAHKASIEKDYLRSKIAPHFVFNVINHIYAMAVINDKKLPEVVRKLSAVLDYYMVGVSEKTVEMTQELYFYNQFIDLEQERFDHVIQVNMETAGDPEGIWVAPLLFESFINNAFKYTPHNRNGKIDIRFDFTEPGKIIFSCTNTLFRNHKESDIVSSRHGLDITRKRLDLLYPDRYDLQNFNQNDFYSVQLIIIVNEK